MAKRFFSSFLLSVHVLMKDTHGYLFVGEYLRRLMLSLRLSAIFTGQPLDIDQTPSQSTPHLPASAVKFISASLTRRLVRARRKVRRRHSQRRLPHPGYHRLHPPLLMELAGRCVGVGSTAFGGKRWIYIKEIEQRRTHTYLATDSSKRSVKYPSNKVIGYLAARDARLVKKLADCSLQQLGDWPGLTKWHSWARGCDPLSTAHRLHLHQQDLYIKLQFVVLDTGSCSRLWWKDCRWMLSYLC